MSPARQRFTGEFPEAQPPMASWGSLIAEGAEQINSIRIYWWLIIFPGGVPVSTLLALNFLGDGLRDARDVRSGN